MMSALMKFGSVNREERLQLNESGTEHREIATETALAAREDIISVHVKSSLQAQEQKICSLAADGDTPGTAVTTAAPAVLETRGVHRRFSKDEVPLFSTDLDESSAEASGEDSPLVKKAAELQEGKLRHTNAPDMLTQGLLRGGFDIEDDEFVLKVRRAAADGRQKS